MPSIKFRRPVQTLAYGTVEAGQVVDVSGTDAERYVRHGIADTVEAAKPTRRRSEPMQAEAD